jgi:hypothetical protein
MLPPAPAPVRRSRPQALRHPPLRADRPVPRPVAPEETESLRPRGVAGALFPPREEMLPERPADEHTAVTLPPARDSASLGRRRRHRPEREFLVLFGIASALAVGAMAYGGPESGGLDDGDFFLAVTLLLSCLVLVGVGFGARFLKP